MAQTKFVTTQEVADFLNWNDVIRQEVVTTSGDGTTLNFALSNGSLVSGSLAVVFNTGGSTAQHFLDASTLTDSEYSVDLDNGVLTLTAAGATSTSDSGVWVNYKKAPIKDSIVDQLIEQASREVERSTGRRFDNPTSNTQSFTVGEADRIGDTMIFYTDGFPHTAEPTVERNTQGLTDTANWETLTSGAGNQFLSTTEDQDVGRIRIFDNYPAKGTDRLRVSYDYGYTDSSVRPLEVKQLTIYHVAKEVVLRPAFTKSISGGFDKFLGLTPTILQNEIDALTNQLRRFRSKLI